MNFAFSCFRCKFLCKVTKMKANHNYNTAMSIGITAVSSYAKLLK